jgi:hypothetical protein
MLDSLLLTRHPESMYPTPTWIDPITSTLPITGKDKSGPTKSTPILVSCFFILEFFSVNLGGSVCDKNELA